MIKYTCDVCGAPAQPIADPIEFTSSIKPTECDNDALIVIQQHIHIRGSNERRSSDLCFACYKRILTELYEKLIQR